MNIVQRIAHFFGLATLKDLENLGLRSLRAAKPNPVQIAETYPVYFTTPDGSGPAYVASHRFQPFALRHGLAVRFVGAGQAHQGTYGYIAANPEIVEIDVGSVLTAAGQLETAETTISAIEIVQASDIGAEEYETITGVPDGGFLEGSSIGSTPTVGGGGGVYGAAELDVWTSTGFVVRMSADAPVVFQ
jgi:hypothetical protein